MPRGALEVFEYVPRPATLDALPQHRPYKSEDLWSRLRLEHRTLTSFAAALIVLAVHIGLIAPAVWAGGTSRQRQEQGFRGDTALQWVVLDDSPRAVPVTAASLPFSGLVAVGAPDISPPLPAVSPPVPSSKDQDAQSDEHSSLGALYGRYVGQIRARVDRAWKRPRTAIGSPIFQCQVQIDQDFLGRVGQITLLQCNGDAPWRLSVVHAIEAASPLPAPPDPAVFARHVILELRAMAYSSGMPAGLYEAAASSAASARPLETARHAQNAFQTLRQAAMAPHSHKALELRIEGSKVEVEPDPQ
ncbi:MAG TPA: TonB C-terminal domain-containing protein [Steroidobacteraceae bacterium]|nr:TonB C-terminal domain-containing protein [Steroidobacteraceae bacterium]